VAGTFLYLNPNIVGVRLKFNTHEWHLRSRSLACSTAQRPALATRPIIGVYLATRPLCACKPVQSAMRGRTALRRNRRVPVHDLPFATSAGGRATSAPGLGRDLLRLVAVLSVLNRT
jgi:glycerol-3-phosphate dehydrogenase